jgi:hypothetical protein
MRRYTILNRHSNYFSQLLIAHCDVRLIELHKIATANLKRYKSPGSDTIPAKLIKAGGETLLSVIHSLVLFGIRKICLFGGRSLLFYQVLRRGIKLTAAIIRRYHCYRLHTKFYTVTFFKGEVHACNIYT